MVELEFSELAGPHLLGIVIGSVCFGIFFGALCAYFSSSEKKRATETIILTALLLLNVILIISDYFVRALNE